MGHPRKPPEGYTSPKTDCGRCGGTGWEGYMPAEALRPEWYPCFCLKEITQ